MKKTLAAILAAAMALSMSAVAFARDTQPGTSGVDNTTASDGTPSTRDSYSQIMGISKTYEVDPGVIGINGINGNLDTATLAALINDDLVKVDLSVTAGKNELSAQPKVFANDAGKAAMTVKFKDKWGVSGTSATMRIRVTAKANIGTGGGAGALGSYKADGTYDTMWLPKGDTITLDPFTLTAGYEEVTNYGENMTITLSEVDGRFIVAKGEKLYDNSSDDEKVIVYFKDKRDRDVAAYEARISPNQKDVNFGYTTNSIAEVVDAYPDIDFDFINFYAQVSGANRFQNSGTLYFNAIGGADTCVYEVVDGVIDPSQPLDAKYDADDKTVSVSGIRELTQYVVASEALPYDDEPAEDSSSEAPAEVPETPANPSTGAL